MRSISRKKSGDLGLGHRTANHLYN